MRIFEIEKEIYRKMVQFPKKNFVQKSFEFKSWLRSLSYEIPLNDFELERFRLSMHPSW